MEVEVVYWVVRNSGGEAIGVISTNDYTYRGITIDDKTYNIERITKSEFDTYREFEIPLYKLDNPEVD